MKKELTETQVKILDFIKAHPAASPDSVIEGTGLPKITTYSGLKVLVAMKAIEMSEEAGKKIYSAASESVVTKAVVGITNDNHVEEKKEVKRKPDGKRDFTKYKFGGEVYSKGGLVHAMVAQFCKDKKPSITKLKEVFPDELIPTYGVFQEVSVAKKRSGDKQRYFLKPEQVIKLRDGKSIAVTNQLTSAYLDSFMTAAKKVGMKALQA